MLHELERRKAEIGYVRTADGYEVDFHARFPDGREELIQLCAADDSEETLEREWRALTSAAGDFPRARRLLLMLTLDQLPAASPKGIAAQTVYEWLWKAGS